MMKLRSSLSCFLLVLLLGWAGLLQAQPYNNEWIDYSKPHYKFLVGKTGLYRIPQSMLVGLGLSATPVEQFRLYRNGREVTLHSSVASGTLPTNGFLEFWGEQNDGAADRSLYLRPEFQHSTALSLHSDTAAYFLAVYPGVSNRRFVSRPNDIAGNTLAPLTHIQYKQGFYFRNMINNGFATVVGEYVYSSSYDRGEFWSSTDIRRNQVRSIELRNLKINRSAGDAQLRFGAVGNALYLRNVQARVNTTLVKDTAMNFFSDIQTVAPVPIGAMNTGDTVRVSFTNRSDSAQDRMVVSFFELTYPRNLDFGGSTQFEFELPANAAGHYLEITQFNHGGQAPVLYDLNSGERWLGDIAVPGLVRIALPGGANRRLVLASQDPTQITTVTGASRRDFVNYASTSLQGNYLMIVHPSLRAGAGGTDPVEAYRAYRASVAGGQYKPLVADIQQLIDQFAFGIKVHPASVKNFIAYTRAVFIQKPQYVLLLGKGVSYNDLRGQSYNGVQVNESHPQVDKLNLIPTFGWPGSDNMLSANGVSSPVTTVPIGRLSVVTPAELEIYLQKLIEYETNQRTAPHTIQSRRWMKQALNVTGASEVFLGTLLCNYMQGYRILLQDTLLGSGVNVFCKNTVGVNGDDFSSDRVKQLFEEGLTMVTYFGHSSSTNLDFNIEDPENYNSQGKYPVFSVNGCNAGNFFTFNPQRLEFNETLSEKFMLTKQRGSIAFIASTHFGIVNYLNVYLNHLYNNTGKRMYGSTVGQILDQSLEDLINSVGPSDFLGRIHAEEITLHGDPAIRFNYQAKPDYVLEEPQVRINPEFISIAEERVRATVTIHNLGKAIQDSITVTVRRQFPDGSSTLLLTRKLKGVAFIDSLSFQIPIVATRDKGLNKLIVTLDAGNVVDEMSESNNSVSKDFFVFEDEARPAFPYNLSIVNKQGQKLIASTANPVSVIKQYVMEIDTTELFNSPLKRSQTLTSAGGVLEFDPQLSFLDSTVYYWRVALVPAQGETIRWNTSSFVFLNSGIRDGFNQSHYFQHLKSDFQRINLTSQRRWSFGNLTQNVTVRHGYWVTATTEESGVSVQVNGNVIGNNSCVFASLAFFVFDPVTFKPWENKMLPGASEGLYGSWRNDCSPGRLYNFEYRYTDTASRRKMMNFMDNVIPPGAYVLVRAFPLDSATFVGFPQAFVKDWKADTAFLGSGNSLYHRFLAQGFPQIDSFDRQRTFAVMYKKDRLTEFTPQYQFTTGIYDNMSLSIDCVTPDTIGRVTSPVFGPAKAWKSLAWRGASVESMPTDRVTLRVLGVDSLGNETPLRSVGLGQPNLDLSTVSAQQYPYLKLSMEMVDSVNLSPYQLRYWRVDYDPVPEGAIAPNLFYSFKDTLDLGEPINLGVAFKNVSNYAFDSVLVRLAITDKNNVQRIISSAKQKPIVAGDTIRFRFPVDTRDLPGANRLLLDFNPDFQQREQYRFNNFLYKDFFVRGDNVNPLLDVTFDGMHILNRDIVSSKPHIQIKLKDESEFLLLNDTSLITTLQVKYPDANNTIRTFKFDNDTLRFTPAQAGRDNTATIDFRPYFPTLKDASGQPLNPNGDEYELVVAAKDRSGNNAGRLQYRVAFTVIDKPMISNLLNYPNPFTTSTAFVFTITGSEIPTYFKIQILTVTGKIVREITGAELGPLRIGRNITEYKWDGTDQFGQRLANGVYLYRVVTTLNGKAMDRYRAQGDETDNYFNKGYGKMYLMR
jgi:hypothetical protein